MQRQTAKNWLSNSLKLGKITLFSIYMTDKFILINKKENPNEKWAKFMSGKGNTKG